MFAVWCVTTLRMAGKPKGDKALLETLNLRVDDDVARRLDVIAIARSKPGALVKRSDVAREAIEIGLRQMEGTAKVRGR